MKWWGGRNQEDRVGFYTTLVFHLAILVILLAFSVGRVATQEQSFVLDFTKQEELEKLQAAQAAAACETQNAKCKMQNEEAVGADAHIGPGATKEDMNEDDEEISPALLSYLDGLAYGPLSDPLPEIAFDDFTKVESERPDAVILILAERNLRRLLECDFNGVDI